MRLILEKGFQWVRFILSASTLYLTTASSDARTWTDVQGRTMEAEYIDQTADEVTVRMIDERRRVTFSKKLLSEADLMFLKDHIISQKYDRLVQNIYQSKDDVERAVRFAKQPIIVIWRNEMQKSSFKTFLVELLEDEVFHKVVKDRTIFAIMDNPDFHMNLANFGVYDNNKGSPVLTYYYPEYFGGFERPLGVSILTDRSISTVIVGMRRYMANYYDNLRSAHGELPIHWKVNVTGEPQTFFELATLADREKKPYLIIYGDGQDRPAFSALQSATEGKFDQELSKRFRIAYLFEDPELSVRIEDYMPSSNPADRLRIVLFSSNHRPIEMREIGRTYSMNDYHYFVTTINEMMEEGEKVRTNGASSNPFK